MRLTWRLGVVLAGCAAIVAMPLAGARVVPPEVIYHGGVVLTMDEEVPRAEAVAVRAGRILAVGGNAEVLKLRAGSTRVWISADEW